MNLHSKRVLVAPLNWGLGHASRCIPIIRQLISQGAKVSLASDGMAGLWLQKEFPNLDYFELPGYNINYRGGPIFSIIRKAPSIWWTIQQEHRQFNQFLDKHPQDLIISDNRYGIWNSNSENILLTHQLNLYRPQWARSIFTRIVDRLVVPFEHIWIPDYFDQLLSGILSNNANPKVQFIGPLSKFSNTGNSQNIYDLAIVLSGPEPSRKDLELLIIQQIQQIQDYRVIFVRGTNMDIFLQPEFPNLTVKNIVQSAELEAIMQNSKLILCRSGYSSIMDLCQLQKAAVLVPTPGQPEQEYLAQRMKSKGYADMVVQSELNLHQIVQYPQENKWPEISHFKLLDCVSIL